MRNINSTKLTKNTILDKISQVSIFAAYLNIGEQLIEHCINTGELILSPIRYDVNPTCGFRYDNKGKLKFKDFAGYFWGDCFDLVALIISAKYNRTINVSNKEDFLSVLTDISFTFKDVFYGVKKDNNDISKVISKVRNTKNIIELVVRNWNSYDESYWRSFGIGLKELNINYIYPIDQYYINRNSNPNTKYNYSIKDPCYAYMLGVDSNGVNSIKLYFPNRDKGTVKFISNCNHLEGLLNININNDYDVIIITKSTKDRVSLYSVYNKMNDLDIKIGFINIPHETYILKGSEYDWIKSKFKNGVFIYSLMDNDEVGIKEADYLLYEYNIKKLLIPTRYKVKDFADFIKTAKTIDVNRVINTFIKYAKRNIRKFTWYSETDDVEAF